MNTTKVVEVEAVEVKEVGNEEALKKITDGQKATYKLSRSVKVLDKEYSELTVDFGSLTGVDMEAAASESATNKVTVVNEFSKSYLMIIVARASGITINELRMFPISDCTLLTLAAMGFLMGAASEATLK
jgi:hypothetical protein